MTNSNRLSLNRSSFTPQTLVVGLGSPHGDDAAGWLVVQQLQSAFPSSHISYRQASSPADLLDWLEGVRRLVICDACSGLGALGETKRWQWPSAELTSVAWSGTHDLSLPTVLQLAQLLGTLPSQVTLWAIEGATTTEFPSEMQPSLSPEVLNAIPILVTHLVDDLNAQILEGTPHA